MKTLKYIKTKREFLLKKKGRNTLLVPVFRGCFRFGPSVLISFNWVPFFLIRFQFYP
jgi:hypothetical protein